MQFHWLNKNNNDNLIVFFAGWSFDYKPFDFLDCGDFDVLAVYDYNDISHFEQKSHKFINYRHKYLISWSMGVYTAYKFRKIFADFDKKIAVNGTVFPVDDEFGIPQKPFLLTLRHAKTGLEGKFYQNIFDKPEEFQRYIKTPVERTIDNRVEELQALYENIKTSSKVYEKFYDKALISSNDKIIPPKNQINFWQNFNVPFELLECGHFPYYNFTCWNDILCR